MRDNSLRAGKWWGKWWGKMSIVKALLSRQFHPSGGSIGSQRWLLKDMKLHHQDVVQLEDEFQDMEDDMLRSTPACVCRFTPEGLHGHLLGVAGEDGCVRLFDTRKQLSESPQFVSSELVSNIECCKDTIYGLAWITGGERLLTAAGTGVVDQWDVHGNNLGSFKFHQRSVKCVDAMKNEPSKFVSGCRDGTICVWDTRYSSSHKPVNVITSTHHPKNSPSRKRRRGLAPAPTPANISVTGVLFHGDNKLASAGCGDGVVKLWDLRKHYSSLKNGLPTPWLTFDPIQDDSGHIGFSSLTADSHQSALYATCRDNFIYKYNSNGVYTKPVGAFGGSVVSSLYVKSCLSPDDKFLLSGSGCGSGVIWEVDNPDAPPLILPTHDLWSHPTEVTATAWGPCWDKVVTCTDTSDVAVWRVHREEPWPKPLPGRHRMILSNYVNNCEEYEGEGHLKSSQVLRKYKSSSARTPLQPLNTRQGHMEPNTPQHPLEPCTPQHPLEPRTPQRPPQTPPQESLFSESKKSKRQTSLHQYICT